MFDRQPMTDRLTDTESVATPQLAAMHWGRYYGAMFRQSQRFIREACSEFGFSYNEVIVLVYIMEHPDTIQDRIAHDLCLDKGMTTKLLKGLESGGYISRTVDESNQRKKRVRICDAALPCLNLVNYSVHEFNERILASIPSDARDRFLNELHDVSKATIDIDYASLASEVRERFQNEQV